MSDDTLVAALARAQAKFTKIDKGQENKHFGSQYADIAAVLAVVRPVLAAEGIAVVQPIRLTVDGCELVTALLKGEERIESVLPLDVDGKEQALGSRLTYLRRYQLCALVGVHPEGDDDDGNAASEAPRETSWQGGTRYPIRTATPKQVTTAEKLLAEVVQQNLELAYIEEHAGRAVPVAELSTAECSKLIDQLLADKKAGKTPGDAIPDDGTEPFA